VLTGWCFRSPGVDGIACICCSSKPTGSSTWRTFPMKPSSTRIPNSWSGLCLVNVIRYARKEKRSVYQFAILWHAASSIGPPCAKKAGPSVEINWVNKVGYGNWDNSTRDLCDVVCQNGIEVMRNDKLVCSHAWMTCLSFG